MGKGAFCRVFRTPTVARQLLPYFTSPIYGGGARRVNILHRMFKSGLSWRFYCTLKRLPYVTRRRGFSLKQPRTFSVNSPSRFAATPPPLARFTSPLKRGGWGAFAVSAANRYCRKRRRLILCGEAAEPQLSSLKPQFFLFAAGLTAFLTAGTSTCSHGTPAAKRPYRSRLKAQCSVRFQSAHHRSKKLETCVSSFFILSHIYPCHFSL